MVSRLDEHQRGVPVPPDSSQCDPKDAVARPKAQTPGAPLRGRQVLTSCKILHSQFLMAATCQCHPTAHQDQQFQHEPIGAGGAA